MYAKLARFNSARMTIEIGNTLLVFDWLLRYKNSLNHVKNLSWWEFNQIIVFPIGMPVRLILEYYAQTSSPNLVRVANHVEKL